MRSIALVMASNSFSRASKNASTSRSMSLVNLSAMSSSVSQKAFHIFSIALVTASNPFFMRSRPPRMASTMMLLPKYFLTSLPMAFNTLSITL